MTDERTGPATHDPRAALPLWPWHALRPTTGMLLGVDDFEVLGGNPRAKQQLHNAWLHGPGVVWGFGLRQHGVWELAVEPGLAIDGWGRELHLDAPACISFKELVEGHHDPTCRGRREVEVCLVAHFDACLDAPVPALADPCDVTRQSTEYSRVVSRVRLEVTLGCPEPPSPAFHRVRVLLGLDTVRDARDEAGREALCRRNEVLAAPAQARARKLLWHVRCLAALDAADRGPAGGDCDAGFFPVTEADAGVLLGCIRLTIKDESGCPHIVNACVDTCLRPTLLPTSVIHELLCGLAPGLIGSCEPERGVGPQVVPDSIEWSKGNREISFAVTDDLLKATLTMDSVVVTSLSDRGWIVEDLRRRPRYHSVSSRAVAGEGQDQPATEGDRPVTEGDHLTTGRGQPAAGRVTVQLADRPAHPLIRVTVRGTGPTPLYGADPRVPLAGVVGDDPGHTGQGRDAVLTAQNPLCKGADDEQSDQ